MAPDSVGGQGIAPNTSARVDSNVCVGGGPVGPVAVNSKSYIPAELAEAHPPQDDVAPAFDQQGASSSMQGVSQMMMGSYSPCVVQCPRCTQVLSIAFGPKAPAAVPAILANPIQVPVMNMVSGPDHGPPVRQASPLDRRRGEGRKRVRDRGYRQEGRPKPDQGGSGHSANGRQDQRKGRNKYQNIQQRGGDKYQGTQQRGGGDRPNRRSNNRSPDREIYNRCCINHPHCDHDSGSDTGSSSYDVRPGRDTAWRNGGLTQGPREQRSLDQQNRRNPRNPFTRR